MTRQVVKVYLDELEDLIYHYLWNTDYEDYPPTKEQVQEEIKDWIIDDE